MAWSQEDESAISTCEQYYNRELLGGISRDLVFFLVLVMTSHE